MAGRWLDVGEAAYELGLSTDAVRKRIARGSLVSEERDGRRVVWLAFGGTGAGRESAENAPSDREPVDTLRTQVDDLREQLRAEREANRENRRLLAAALERIPELEASPATAAEAQSAGEEPGGIEDPGEYAEPEAATSQRRSWWRRLLGR